MKSKLVNDIIRSIGDDPTRDGLLGTPTRVAKALPELFSGYKPLSALNKKIVTFNSDNDQMVVRTGIPVYSWCEHHIMPFFGICHIGYIPKGQVIGISKLNRIVDHYSRRLQIQENLTREIAAYIENRLVCLGVMVVLDCAHTCMIYRGVKDSDGRMITSDVRGVFRESAAVRNEFLNFIRNGVKA